MDWYYLSDGKQEGPTNVESLKRLVQTGALKPSDYVWNETMGEKWSRVVDVPVLGAVQASPAGGEAAQREEFARRIAERQAAEKKSRRRVQTLIALVLLLVGGGIAAAWWWKATEPCRRLGITSENPLGSFAILDAYFTKVHQMEKAETNVCENAILDPAWRIFTYSNPRAPRGQNVSGRGAIFLMVDKADKLQAVYMAYISPGGPRGPMGLINESVVSLFAVEYWKALGGSDVTIKDEAKKEKILNSADYYALAEIPKGSYCVIDKSRVRGVWIEYDKYGFLTKLFVRIPAAGGR